MGNTVSGHKHKKHHSRRRKQRGGEPTSGSVPATVPVPAPVSGLSELLTNSVSGVADGAGNAMKRTNSKLVELNEKLAANKEKISSVVDGKVGSFKAALAAAAAAANVGGRKSRKRSGHKSGHNSGHKRKTKRVRFSTE